LGHSLKRKLELETFKKKKAVKTLIMIPFLKLLLDKQAFTK